MIFLGAALGTFVLYLTIGELSGMSDGTPMADATSRLVVVMLAKAIAILTTGHTIALWILARARRGHVEPPLRRSAIAGLVCATALDVMYLGGPWLQPVSSRGLFRLVLATGLSFVLCAIRSRRPESESESDDAPGVVAETTLVVERG